MSAHKDHPEYTTSRGIRVYPVYYKQVAKFDPDREGYDWWLAKKTEQGEKRFRQFYEIDFEAAEGGLVYANWDRRIHVLYQPDLIDFKPYWTYVVGIDPGTVVTAAIWKVLTDDGIIIAFDEYYAGSGVEGSSQMSATEHAKEILRISQFHTDKICGKDEHGNSNKLAEDFFDAWIIDPSSSRVEGSSEDLGSVTKRYNDAGIWTTDGTRDVLGGIERVRELERPQPNTRHPEGLHGDVHPRKYICPHMKMYAKEKTKYHYPKSSDNRTDKSLNIPVKKNDHLMDCDRMTDVWLRDAPSKPTTYKPKSKLDRFYERIKKSKWRSSWEDFLR